MTREEQLHQLLNSCEDNNLSQMLESSEVAILSLVGSKDSTDPRVRELILERARYVYNDQVEFFYGNFQGDLMALSLENYKLEEKHD